MVAIDPRITHKYNLGPVKDWVLSAAYFLGNRHDIRTIGGWRKTDQFPDHPSGHAIDIMVPNLSVGAAVAQDAINNYKQLGVSYLIFNHRVWNPKQGWHPYTSTSNPHTDHVHITLWNPGTGVPGGTVPKDVAVGGSGNSGGTSDATADSLSTCAWHVKFAVFGESCLATHVQARQALGLVAMSVGLTLGLVGAVLLVVYGMGKTQTGATAVAKAVI